MSEINYLLLAARDELRALKDLILENKFLFLFIFIIFAAGLYYIDPLPDREVRVAASGRDSAYALIAKNQEPYLNEKGISLVINSTQSSSQSAAMLAQSVDGINAAFIQGGVLNNEEAQKIQSLGSIDFEPVWIFYRKGLASHPDRLKDLAKLRVGVGPTHSGTWIIAKKLFALNGIETEANSHFHADSYENNASELLSGRLDALINVNPIGDPVVAKLLRDSRVGLFELTHASAYDKHLPFVKVLTLTAASIDFARQIPHKDISLLATTTNLAISKEMHPALQVMLLAAVRDAQRTSQNIFLSNEENFPAYMDTSIPISEAASDFYDYGVPQTMRYLPFWLAGLIDRIWVYVLALLAIIIPLSQFNFNLRSLRFGMRIEKIQRELLTYEQELNSQVIPPDRVAYIKSRVDQLIKNEDKQNIPAGCASDYYDFLGRLTDFRSKLQK
jgi:TRAP-type uncharacterized transport system substrate-binding protein